MNIKKSHVLCSSMLIFLYCSPEQPEDTVYSDDYLPLHLGHCVSLIRTDTLGNRYDSSASYIGSSYFLYTDSVYVSTTRSYGTLDTIDWTEHIVSRGNDVFGLSQDSTYVKFAQHQYRNGDRWINGRDSLAVDTFKVAYKGRVSVKAGIFDSCFSVTRTGRGFADTAVYAPDVGMVRKVEIGVSGKSITEMVKY